MKMSFESMFRLSIRFINETSSVNKEELICRYLDKVHSELHVSYEVMKKLLTSMSIQFPKKYNCTICEMDIVHNPHYTKCEKCKDYTHISCKDRHKFCGNYCPVSTSKPTIVI
jgi:hypothetical protein